MPAPIDELTGWWSVGEAGIAPVARKASISAEFSKVKITPNSDPITGSLNIFSEAYRIRHGGIMIMLDPRLNLYYEKKFDPDLPWKSMFCSTEILKGCPTSAGLSARGDLLQRTVINFELNIPPHKSHPVSFDLPRRASLRYRLRAYIKRDKDWEEIAEKLMNFKGYYHIPLELHPFVESKKIQTKVMGEIVSTFRVPNTAAIMGQKDGLQASLELQGVLEGQVNATLTFLRITTFTSVDIYPNNIRTKLISSQNGQAEVHQKNTIFKWVIAVPMMDRISYTNELVPDYSVRYYLKYEVFMGADDKAAISGTVEVEIGTSRDPCEDDTSQSMSGATNKENSKETYQIDGRPSAQVAMISVPFSFTITSPRPGLISAYEANEFAGTNQRNPRTLLSWLSMRPFDKLHPQYDDFKEE